MNMNRDSFSCAQFIKQIGRGKDNPTDLSYDDARAVWGAVLDGAVSDLEMGALLIAMRIKGETVEEIAGFMAATEAHMGPLPLPRSELPPVVIPSYNGARKMPNLTPLLALLLAREGVPVLVHGKTGETDVPVLTPGPPGRVTSAEIFHAMGIPAARDTGEAGRRMERGEPAFVPIALLNPALARVLSLRRIIGLRNSAHTLVKMLQPFAGPALRLASYTHPEYLKMLTGYYLRDTALAEGGGRGDVLLSRGTEGEAVANAKRSARIDWFHGGECTVVVEAQTGVLTDLPILPASHDAATTAVWIQSVLSGERPVPDAIGRQVAAILQVLRTMRERGIRSRQAA